MRKRVAVIGAGIFGSSIAIELSKNFDVTIYERSEEILSGASTNNHLRHHKGYHYPRSKNTALECIRAQESFEREYGKCIIRPFDHYQAIAKEGSKVTPKQYLQFCDELGLAYEIIDFDKVDNDLINKNRAAIIIKIPEYSYDPKKMIELAKEKLKFSNVEVKLNNEIIGGEIKENRLEKNLKVLSPEGEKTEEFDFVVNATYSEFNNFNKWFGLPQKKVLYEAVEMIEIELPIERKIGLSTFDGQFGTIMPRPEKGRFTLAHIKESILEESIGSGFNYKIFGSGRIKTNMEKILKASAIDYPIIKEAKVIRPIYITRVVKANVDDTDERPSEITDHGNGLYTVFSGKIVTCVDTAKKIARLIEEKSEFRDISKKAVFY